MADVKIRVVGEDAASKELGKVSKSLEEIKSSAGEAGQGAKGMGVDWEMALIGINQGLEIARKAVELFKQTYDFAREGAQLDYLSDRFENLSTSIGTTSNLLLIDLREATRGLMSDSELMEGATQMMALGLANTHDEAVRLATVAGALNMNINQLTLTLTNQSIRRFDNLGVSIDGFTEKVEALEKAGMSAQDAFTEAFLQQAEEQIERVGHAADSAIGDFERLEAAIGNMTNNAKRSLGELIQPVISGLADSLSETAEFQSLLNMAVDEGVISQEEHYRYVVLARYAVFDYNQAIEELKDALREAGEEQKFAADMAYGYAVQAAIAAGATWDEIAAISELGGAAEDAASSLSPLETALKNTETAMRDLGIATEERNRMMEEYLLLTGQITEEELFLERVQRDLIQAWADGVISVEDYSTAMDAVTGLLEDGQIEVANYLLALAGIPSEIITKILQEYYKVDYGWVGGREAAGILDRQGTAATTYWRAAGGEIHAAGGMPVHWVGEVGPEPFIPAVSGRIVSNTQAVQAVRESRGGAGGANIYVTINTPVNMADRAFVERELAPYIYDAFDRMGRI